MITDKGMELTEEQRMEIASCAGLKYLMPIKRNLKKIRDLRLQEYDDMVDLAEESILCKKTKISDDLYYYAFVDLYLQGTESKGHMVRARSKMKKKDTIQELLERYKDKKDSFGTIVFESNIDTTCDDIYQMYTYRWSIEEIFNYYKNVLDITNVRVQQDTRLYGSEFINFIASVIVCRIKNKIDQLALTKKYSYKQIMTYLSKVKKCRSVSAPAEWHNTTVVKYIQDLVKLLKLDV